MGWCLEFTRVRGLELNAKGLGCTLSVLFKAWRFDVKVYLVLVRICVFEWSHHRTDPAKELIEAHRVATLSKGASNWVGGILYQS